MGPLLSCIMVFTGREIHPLLRRPNLFLRRIWTTPNLYYFSYQTETSNNLHHQISKTMFDFEKQFEDMEVVTMTMEGTMDSSTATSTPAEDVDNLIQMVTAVYTFKRRFFIQGSVRCAYSKSFPCSLNVASRVFGRFLFSILGGRPEPAGPCGRL